MSEPIIFGEGNGSLLKKKLAAWQLHLAFYYSCKILYSVKNIVFFFVCLFFFGVSRHSKKDHIVLKCVH
uniref:Uncharacterized protein n=1 Tax=Anguilla anguilla TaxID=7936 RepID=A0A0E9X1I9_ANGAN